MVHRVEVPQVNVNDDVVTVSAWLVADGTSVDKGTAICTIETTKATVDVQSPGCGQIFHFVKQGSRAAVGSTLGWILSGSDVGKVQELRSETNQGSQGKHGPIISDRAKIAIARHGLTEEDFADLTVVREADVEAKAHLLQAEPVADDALIAAIEPSPNAVLIYGTGSQGVTVLDAIRSGDSFVAVGFVDYSPHASSLSGVPVFHARSLPAIARRGVLSVHVCLPDVAHEARVVSELRTMGFRIVTVAHPTASISTTAQIGAGCFFGAHTIVGPEAVLRERVRVLNAASIAHHCRVGSGTRVSDGARLAGNVTIGQDCLLGLNSTVNLRLTVGDRVTIVSGAHVYGHVPSDHVVRIDGQAHPQAR